MSSFVFVRKKSGCWESPKVLPKEEPSVVYTIVWNYHVFCLVIVYFFCCNCHSFEVAYLACLTYTTDVVVGVAKDASFHIWFSTIPVKILRKTTGGHFKYRYNGRQYTFKHVTEKNSIRLSDFVLQYFDRHGTKPEKIGTFFTTPTKIS